MLGRDYIARIREQVENVREVDVLTEDMIWQNHSDLIWKADKFDGKPFFYPIYKYKDFYSYSILALIVKKGNLTLSQPAYEKAKRENFELLDQIIDAEIVRVGGSYSSSGIVTDPEDYCQKVVEALKQDISDIEDRNPGHTNIILCGGKDSLNLLLAPYENPVIALSADPNYPIVCQFVKDNGLDIPVRRLEDSLNDGHLQREVLELCCRFNAVHWRWGHHLKNIGDEFSGKAIFWKGQIGDLYMSVRWKTYMYGEGPGVIFLSKIYNKLSKFLPGFLNHFISRLIIPGVEKRLWRMGSRAQGSHVGFIRALTGCLTLSAYHGPNMSRVLKSVDLGRAVQKDVRDRIGELLFGKAVNYPDQNPAPNVSAIREGLHNPDLFIKLLAENDIKIQTDG